MIRREPRPHLVRGAGGGVVVHEVVGDQVLGPCPILLRHGLPERRLVEGTPSQRDIVGMMVTPQRDGEMPTVPPQRHIPPRGRSGVDEPHTPDLSSLAAARDVVERPRHELDRRPRREDHAVGHSTGQCQGLDPRGGQENRDGPRRRGEPPRVDPEDGALVRDPLAGQQGTCHVNCLVQGTHTARGRHARGRQNAQGTSMTRPGASSSSVAAAIAMCTGCRT